MSHEHREFAWNVHSYINEHIRFGDAKALVIVAWSSALIGALYGVNAHSAFMDKKFSTNVDWSATGWALMSLLSFIILVVSFVLAIIAVRPNLRSSQKLGLVFWESVLGYRTGANYHEAFTGTTENDLVQNLTHHIFDLSGVASSKFRWVNVAIIFAVLGSIFALITALGYKSN